jgi:hypothetical protein
MFKASMMAGLLIAALSSSADAAVMGPRGARSMTEALEGATSIAWVCGPRRCVWRPGWRGVVPRWATWGPPRLRGCFYERRPRGWVEVCPI